MIYRYNIFIIYCIRRLHESFATIRSEYFEDFNKILLSRAASTGIEMNSKLSHKINNFSELSSLSFIIHITTIYSIQFI